jgi:hypothetical protein
MFGEGCEKVCRNIESLQLGAVPNLIRQKLEIAFSRVELLKLCHASDTCGQGTERVLDDTEML